MLKPCEEIVEKEENKKEIKICDENKKILRLIYNNESCDYNIDVINKKINAVKKNEEFYMSLPVLVRENVLMIYDKKIETFVEYRYTNEDSHNFVNFCEEIIIKFINQVEL